MFLIVKSDNLVSKNKVAFRILQIQVCLNSYTVQIYGGGQIFVRFSYVPRIVDRNSSDSLT